MLRGARQRGCHTPGLHRGRLRRLPAVPLVLALLLMGVGGSQLHQYNVTWDEALGDFFFGERNLWFFATLDQRYLQFEANPFPPERVPDLSASAFRDRPWIFYPFANTLAALTSTVTSSWLGVLDPFDGYHAVNLWLGAILLVALYGFVRAEWGALEAFASVGLLFLSPRVVCHMMANIKDFPEMVFFSLTLLQFHRALRSGSFGGLLFAGVLGGMALATKANALFLPFVAAPVALFAHSRERWPSRVRLATGLVGAAAIAATVAFLLWPWLWADPVNRLGQHWDYLSRRAFGSEAHQIDPLLALSMTATLPLLTLFAVGLAVLARPMFERRASALLLGVWLLVVVGRMYLPGNVNFDEMRHFLEVYPALAVVAGVGAGAAMRRLSAVLDGMLRGVSRAARYARSFLPSLAVLGAALGASAWSVVSTHPHEIAYWNPLIGGLPGAVRASLAQPGDYWGMSYALGLRWLNAHAEPHAVLAVPIIEHAVALVAPLRLRPDIALVDVSVPEHAFIGQDRIQRLRGLGQEMPVYVMFVLREEWMNDLTNECLERLAPVAEWRLEGVPLLQIYRYR